MIVKEDSTLLEYILKYIEPNRKKAKTYLTNKLIYINNKNISKYNYTLHKGDSIELRKYAHKKINNNIQIIYEDKDIIVVNKSSGILTISTEKEKENTLYAYMSNYVKHINPKNKIFIIHRLDRDTSGIIMFARSEKVKKLYQENWNNIVKYRWYTAIIEWNLDKKEQTIKLNLKENKNLKTYVAKDGIEAITKYKVIKENNKYSLLDIEIKTGRKNQIRATMEYLHHPIIGDKKYSSTINPIGRLALHANKLVIINPITNKEMIFKTNNPTSFKKII